MRIKKFRHQLFQPAPSSIANQCDNTPNPILVIKKRIRKIAEINSEFHSSHFRKSSLQHSKSHLKKYQQQVKVCSLGFLKVLPCITKNRSKEGQDSLWHRLDCVIRATSQPKRCQYKHHLPVGMAPQCDSASRFLQQWDTEEVSCKSRGKSKLERSLPDLPPGSDTTKLQPLSPSAAVPHKEINTHWFQQIDTNST